MELIYARDIHLGEQNEQGHYITVRPDGTFCELCLMAQGWGYLVIIDDKPGEKCELCG